MLLRCRVFFFALPILLLAACTAPPGQRQVYTGPVQDNEMQLALAEQTLAAGDSAQASRTLSFIVPDELEAAQRTRYQLLQAEIALAEGTPLIALQALPPSGSLSDPPLAARAERSRALALFRTGDAAGATRVLLLREHWIPDPAQRTENRELLWQELQDSDLNTALGSPQARSDPQVRGWLELAMIHRSVWPSPDDLRRRLDEWRTAYPQHPGGEYVARVWVPESLTRKIPAAVALLLPLSGPYAETAQAIRDGFLSAHFSAADPRPTVRIYDTGTTADALHRAYHRALNEDAEFIVGP
ncbi:MAG: penicillin-binding protein activator, partial [Nevskiales bacterium]|nr:penicillin-binding protein activator [Nevskiales bacterium]